MVLIVIFVICSWTFEGSGEMGRKIEDDQQIYERKGILRVIYLKRINQS